MRGLVADVREVFVRAHDEHVSDEAVERQVFMILTLDGDTVLAGSPSGWIAAEN